MKGISGGKIVDSDKPIPGVIPNSAIPTALKSANKVQHGPNHMILLGDWQFKSGNLEPNINGKFAAIVGEFFTRVVWSKYCLESALADYNHSGHGNLMLEGPFLTYCLPPELMDESGLDIDE